MKKTATVLAFLISWILQLPAQADDYKKYIEDKRLQKDSSFRFADDSPLHDEKQKDTFSHLNYYPVNEALNISARFIYLNEQEVVKFKTSSEKVKEYIKYARLEFEINSVSYVLYAYFSETIAKKPGMEGYLFIPFSDLTNGSETYGGGRYIEGWIPKSGNMVLDFNQAYNPYCHYGDGYSCPKIPFGNILDIRIEAGEKLLYKH